MKDADQPFSMVTEKKTSRNWFNKEREISIGHKAELLDYYDDKEKRGKFFNIFFKDNCQKYSVKWIGDVCLYFDY